MLPGDRRQRVCPDEVQLGLVYSARWDGVHLPQLHVSALLCCAQIKRHHHNQPHPSGHAQCSCNPARLPKHSFPDTTPLRLVGAISKNLKTLLRILPKQAIIVCVRRKKANNLCWPMPVSLVPYPHQHGRRHWCALPHSPASSTPRSTIPPHQALNKSSITNPTSSH
ncbi:hypothetical protein M3J09_003743 [Ascochyta lentis]